MTPGGPVETMIAKLEGHDSFNSDRTGGSSANFESQNRSQSSSDNHYRGSQGLPPEIIAEIRAYYGFDKSAYERFGIMIKNYLQFDLGRSFASDKPVIELIKEKMPVTISLGWVLC